MFIKHTTPKGLPELHIAGYTCFKQLIIPNMKMALMMQMTALTTFSWIKNIEGFFTEYYFLQYDTGLILGLRPSNERCRCKVTPSLIGWAQT